MSHRKRGKVSIASLFKCKSQPSTFVHYGKEFQPSVPCESCFPESNRQVDVLEDLGVRNLLCLSLPQYRSIKRTSLQKTLTETLKSVQAHWAQLEYIAKQNCPKIFIAVNETPLDKLLIQFSLEVIQESRRLLVTDANTTHEVGFFFKRHPGSSALIFFGKEHDASAIINLIKELRGNNLDEKTRIIFVSQAYEFSDDVGILNKQFNLIPDARVNFSYSFFLSDFFSLLEKNRDIYISSHFRHEIWKNTPVTMSQVVGFLRRYQKYSENTVFEKWTSGIKSIRDVLQPKFDVMGVGDLAEIARQSRNFIESPKASSYFPSILLDSVMHQAIMVKSMLDCIDEIACHSESQELGKDPALEKFRTLTRILQNHLSFIYPACVDDASIELKTFNHFISNGIVSESSDEVLTVERRIAKNLSQYLDLASDDEDEELAQLPPKEVSIYADLQSLNALKWMVSIVDEMLEIYLSVAKTIYEIRYVDVMEISTFLGKVTCQYTDSFAKQWTEQFDRVVDAALKLFENEGIVERHLHSSNVAIIYCALPFQEERVLLLIHQISQLF